jgi:two-component system, sensor histidine kinase
LIVSDLALRASESGFDVIRQIRELAGEQIPAIVVTGDLTQKLGEQDPASRIWIVHKPVNPLRFRHLLERILGSIAAAAE